LEYLGDIVKSVNGESVFLSGAFVCFAATGGWETATGETTGEQSISEGSCELRVGEDVPGERLGLGVIRDLLGEAVGLLVGDLVGL